MKTCLDILMGAIISEMWYYEQVLIIENLQIRYRFVNNSSCHRNLKCCISTNYWGCI